MKYAVIQTGGKQYKVSEGDTIETERLPISVGKTHPFHEVLLLVSDEKRDVGTPFVSGVEVMATVLEHTKGEKIRVSKFKAKVRYRRVLGHRQMLSRVKIDRIKEMESSKSLNRKKSKLL